VAVEKTLQLKRENIIFAR